MLAALAATVAGCATTPVPNSEARPAPADRVFDARFQQDRPGCTHVTIKRDAGFEGSFCASRIFVDGVHVANIAPGEKIEGCISEGDHIFGAEANSGCGGALTEVKSTIRAGAPESFRVGYDAGGHFSIQATAF